MGSSRFILVGLATLTGSSRFILVGLATLTGSSRLILGGLGNQKKLVPPGTLALRGLEEPFFQLCCYLVSVFGSGGKKVSIYICMYYLEYNTVVVVC